MAQTSKSSGRSARVVNNEKTMALDPYPQLCLQTLLSAIGHAETRWLYLDKETRSKLEDDGLDKQDLEQAINNGVKAGLLARTVVCGVPCVRLAESECAA
jgi:hypothetical protein